MQAEQQSERDLFEAWYCKDAERQGFPLRDGIADLREEDHYGAHRAMLNGKWEGWQARAALSHPSPQGWQPIETCPMDTMVIFGPTKRMTGPCIGMHHSRDGWVTETPSEWASIYPPKEWMPLDLPPPPEQGSKNADQA